MNHLHTVLPGLMVGFPHYDFRMRCDPPLYCTYTYRRKGGHTPLWIHSKRWATVLLSHQDLVIFCYFLILRRRSLNKVCSCFGHMLLPSTSWGEERGQEGKNGMERKMELRLLPLPPHSFVPFLFSVWGKWEEYSSVKQWCFPSPLLDEESIVELTLLLEYKR